MSDVAARPVVRWMWMVLGSLLTVFLVGFGTLNIVGVLAHEERTEVTVFDEPVDVLDVRTSAGSVEVIGTDTEVVTVTAHISDGLFDSSFSANLEDGRLEIRASCPEVSLSPWCSIRYTIEVPASVATNVSSSHDSVSVSDVNGPVTASSSHGSVTLNRLGGDVTATSSQGSVRGNDLRSPRVDASSSQGRVELRFAEPPEWVSARSSQGSTEIVVPEDSPPYRIDTNARGSVNSQIRTDPESEFAIIATSSQGSVTIRYG